MPSVGAGAFALAVAGCLCMIASSRRPLQPCIPYMNMPDGDLPNMPLTLPNSTACADRCESDEACVLYTFVGPASPHCHATSEGGCCWMKSAEVSGAAPTIFDPYACSAWVRLPPGAQRAGSQHPNLAQKTPSTPPKKNVLYIVVDDLRPDLVAYGQNQTYNPSISKLAAGGLVFDQAYCQIAVCSPSRLSFMTGRRPDHAGFYNFINHFRQSDCGIALGDTQFRGETYRTVNTGSFDGGCQWGGKSGACGGSGQCCSLCSQDSNCSAWTYGPGNLCNLKSVAGEHDTAPGMISGFAGSRTPSSHGLWTSNPGNFKQNGYLCLQSGKLFHTEEGGVGNVDPNLNGPGMPPNEDPPSWSSGLSMEQVNAVANMWPTTPDELNGVPASLDGILDGPPSSTANQLCDRIISTDAVAKLRLAAWNLNTTAQPFFMAVGFRKPHLAFRFPAPWLEKLLPENKTAIALHPTLDASVPPIAHGDHAPGNNPYTDVPKETAQQWRTHYYGAIAWMDSQVGKVLDELDSLGHTHDTLVVLHADHGWSLGEHGEWQKFSNFEHGTRVPLIMRAPWIPASVGARTPVLAELIDVFPTMADLAGIPLPPGEHIDGKSLAPVIKAPEDMGLAANLKPYAISQYMRCPTNESVPWRDNACLFTDRVLFPVMGYTLRTQSYRYTEWTRWNGTTLAPDLTPAGLVGVELYSHHDVGLSYSFDTFENENEAASNPTVVTVLRAVLHEALANQTRIASLPPIR